MLIKKKDGVVRTRVKPLDVSPPEVKGKTKKDRGEIERQIAKKREVPTLVFSPFNFLFSFHKTIPDLDDLNLHSRETDLPRVYHGEQELTSRKTQARDHPWCL